MNFVSSDYAAFLVLVFAAWWLVRPLPRLRLALVLAASLLFYGWWNAKYVLLLLASTVVDYALARALGSTPADTPGGARRRKLLVTLSLVLNLGVLAVFKYWGFLAQNLAGLGMALPAVDVLLPPGISFYTFQSLSYTIDIYRGKIAPARSLLEYAFYIAFFPQLVAGPIVRASDFLPQLLQAPRLERADLLRGVYRICCGLTKKMLIADVLAAELVDRAFAHGSTIGGAWAWLAVYGYALQIYGDFSGYSDIAIGSAQLFGFRLVENFDAPYRARNLQEFWWRWHISLSTWFREYLYVPLGGNRKGAYRTQANLLITMALSGLWHGAAWKFVLWGCIHGVGLLWVRLWNALGWSLPGRLGHLAAVLLTAHFAALAFVPFRALDVAHAGDLLARVVRGGSGATWTPELVLAFALGLLSQALSRPVKRRIADAFVDLPAPLAGAVVAVWFAVLAALRHEGMPFIYFQF